MINIRNIRIGQRLTIGFGLVIALMVLLAGLAVFLFMAFSSGSVPQEDDPLETSVAKAALMTVGGLVLLVIGAHFLVESASTIARTFGISEAVIGLTIVAVGTSLPELATSVIAAYRRQTEIAVGNIVGSNIFNIFGILGTTALIAPIPAEARFAAIDMPWEFKPQQHTMTVRLGENGLAFYEAYNPTSRPIAGTASYNVAPDQAGGYFIKIECFCFTEQVLHPGERVVMPVSFYVDPTMLDNAEAAGIPEITLSYTFHQTPLPEQQAGLTGPAVTPSATVEN